MNEKKIVFKCNFCNKEFDNFNKLEEHFVSYHKIPKYMIKDEYYNVTIPEEILETIREYFSNDVSVEVINSSSIVKLRFHVITRGKDIGSRMFVSILDKIVSEKLDVCDIGMIEDDLYDFYVDISFTWNGFNSFIKKIKEN